jgi:hypothetical protein
MQKKDIQRKFQNQENVITGVKKDVSQSEGKQEKS